MLRNIDQLTAGQYRNNKKNTFSFKQGNSSHSKVRWNFKLFDKSNMTLCYILDIPEKLGPIPGVRTLGPRPQIIQGD